MRARQGGRQLHQVRVQQRRALAEVVEGELGAQLPVRVRMAPVAVQRIQQRSRALRRVRRAAAASTASTRAARRRSLLVTPGPQRPPGRPAARTAAAPSRAARPSPPT